MSRVRLGTALRLVTICVAAAAAAAAAAQDVSSGLDLSLDAYVVPAGAEHRQISIPQGGRTLRIRVSLLF